MDIVDVIVENLVKNMVLLLKNLHMLKTSF